MLIKSELKALWKKTGFRPVKRLGQNFLVDKNIRDKILRNLELSPDDTVVEIGAGFGELTFDLARLVKKVFAVEKDKKIAAALKNDFEIPKNVHLIEKDFLDLDLEKIAGGEKVVVYGNLPYYITSPIIEKLFGSISLIKDIYFVVQKELADRILAKPGSRSMGRLTLYVQYYTEPRFVFKIGKNSFYPAPQIESAFLRLEILKKKQILVKDENLLFNIIKKAYSQRRKTILNSLSDMGLKKDTLADLLKDVRINPLARAEDLSLQDFAHLSNIYPT